MGLFNEYHVTVAFFWIARLSKTDAVVQYQTTILELARHLAQPGVQKSFQHRSAGPFSALYHSSSRPKGRRQTLVVFHNQFLILIDEFSSAKPKRFSLTLTGPGSFQGRGRRHVIEDEKGPLVVHPLGDYSVHAGDSSLSWHQQVASGRFLLAMTRDANADVRVLNGWAVEYRTPTMIYHVLHSNRSRRERPIGPIRTDARFALVSFQKEQDAQECAPFENSFAVLEAGRIQWGENRLLTSTMPMDLQFQLTPMAREPEIPAS